jgi:uncharacterized protein
MQVPWKSLSEEALLGVVEEFILREGTDYGQSETDHATKVRQVLRQLEKSEIGIFYDADLGSTTLVPIQ